MSKAYAFVSEGVPMCILCPDILPHPMVMKTHEDGIMVSHGGETCILPWEDVMTLRDYLNVVWRERP